ncbi:MAG: phosphatase [Clostridia bacterium]|nr:phosphatase [Clostridia bacterium]
MNIQVDTHTHTNASTHAYGTLWENVKIAKEKGLKGICMTNHAPNLPDSPHLWHFDNLIGTIPEVIDGVRVFCGAEANILDSNGTLDLPENILSILDVVIASVHIPCFNPMTEEEYTKSWLSVTQNPYVTILGHTGRFRLGYDHEAVISAVRDANQCIEINNHSFVCGQKPAVHCREIALTCKKLGAKIVVSSDAHTPFAIGETEHAMQLLEEIKFPEELIMNLTLDRFSQYLKERKEHRS